MAQRATEFRWKIKIVMWALDVTYPRQLAEILYPVEEIEEQNDELADEKMKLQDKWTDNIDGYLRGQGSTVDSDFYERIKTALGIEITNAAFKNGPALEFYHRLNQQQQERVNSSGDEELFDHLFPSEAETSTKASADDGEPAIGSKQHKGPHAHAHPIGKGFKVFHVSPAYKNPDVHAAIAHGGFDQRFLYLDADACLRWHKLTSVPRRYPTFESCLSSLTELLASEEWSALLEARPVSTVLVFGAGAARKDVELLDNLARRKGDYDKPRSLTYILLDTSFYMLLATAEEVERLKGEDYETFLDLILVVGDFINFDPIKTSLADHKIPLRRDDTRTLFWIPGNTIGNIDVEQFVKNLHSEGRSGDIFLLGIEFADTKNMEAYTKTLISHYDNDDLRQLVLPPVRAYLDKEKIDCTHNEVKNVRRIKDMIKVRPGSRHPRSPHIPDKVTVEIVAELADDKELMLATSSRYDKDELLTFLKKYEFTLVRAFQLKKDPYYQQLLFVRT